MIIELNLDKSPFLHIGPFGFSFGTPEFDVDPDELDSDIKRQFLYNLRKGVLKTLNREDVRRFADVAVVAPLPGNVEPIRLVDSTKNMEDALEKNNRLLKKILAGSIPTVMKEATNLRLGSLRKLMEFEEEGKDRRKLIEFFSKRLEIHAAEVAEAKGEEGLEAGDMVKVNTLSTQLSDIVESEEEQILVPLDVLNDFKTGA